MEIRVLKYFLTVARKKNVTHAAEELNITQPSLSRQIAQLEDELGVKLFERCKKGLILTEDGLFLRQRAEEIVELADKTKQDFEDRRDLISGVISIGCTETMAAAVLPELLKGFSLNYPNVKYELFNGNSDGVKERLDKGLTDIGIVFEPINAEKYAYKRYIKPISWGVLIPNDDQLSKNEFVTADMLLGKSLILPSTASQKAILVNWFKQSNVHPEILANYNAISSAVLLAQNGVGYAICPETVYKIADCSLLCFKPLKPKRPTNGVFIWKKDKIFSTVSAKMIEHINNAF